MASRTWTCGNGHTFVFGNEEWHHESTFNQGELISGAPIPRHCTEVFSSDDADPDAGRYEGEPCMDSTSLIYN